jgi:hypothetical protein
MVFNNLSLHPDSAKPGTDSAKPGNGFSKAWFQLIQLIRIRNTGFGSAIV